MKRDMDLTREILLNMEDFPEPDISDYLPPIEGYTKDQIFFHTWLMYDAGLIDALNLSGGSDFVWIPKHITWEGYEFLEAARNKSIWEEAKSIVLSKTGGLALDVLKSLLIELAKGRVTNLAL